MFREPSVPLKYTVNMSQYVERNTKYRRQTLGLTKRAFSSSSTF